MSKTHSTIKSFSYAFDGIKHAFRNEPNFRVHIALALLVSIVAFFLKFSPVEWAILAVTIFLVISLEMVNTALEAVVDLVSPEIREMAKVAKDVTAGAVFFSALLAISVALLLFLPKVIIFLNL
jgi:diacylglycerol kinase